MNAPSSSLDATSKRWLALLAVAIVISVVILTRSFLGVLAPPQEKSTIAQQPEATEAKDTAVPAEWGNSQGFRAAEEQHATTGQALPPNNYDLAARKKADEAARVAMVHNQAQDLRAMIKQNKLPKAYGHLTLEQVDEMEKNGIVIE